MTDLDRRRTACHEAGHAVAALLRGDVPAVVSLRRAPGHEGVHIGHGPGRLDFGGRHARTRPLALADPDLRRVVELAILGILAGDAAEDVLAPRLGRLPLEPPPDAVAAEVAALPGDGADRLADAEARPPDDYLEGHGGDELAALELAWRLVSQRAGPFLVWMQAEARAFVTDHAAAILACAEELAARTIVPGADLAAIVDRIEGEGEAHAETPPPVPA